MKNMPSDAFKNHFHVISCSDGLCSKSSLGLWKFSSLATLVAVLLAPGSHFPGDRNGTGVHGTDLWLHKAIQHIHRYNN